MENILRKFRTYAKKTSEALAPFQDQNMGQFDKMEKRLAGYLKSLLEFADLISDKVNTLVLENPVADALRDLLIKERDAALSDFQMQYRPS